MATKRPDWPVIGILWELSDCPTIGSLWKLKDEIWRVFDVWHTEHGHVRLGLEKVSEPGIFWNLSRDRFQRIAQPEEA